MIFGRLILVSTTYYNKIIDHEDFSYFVSLNRVRPVFIKIASNSLDRKVFIYTNSIVIEEGNTLQKIGMPLDELLKYSPFVKGDQNKRKNYYREKNPTPKTIMEKKPITLKFE